MILHNMILLNPMYVPGSRITSTHFNTGLYKLIPDMYTYEMFEVLRFKWNILVDIPDDFYFSRLKVLEFCYVTFSSYECVKEILLECPVLEDLVIKKCRWLSGHRLTVCGSELRNLTLKCSEWSHGQKRLKIVIDTPELETLKITDSTLADIYVKDPLENIITAHISVGVVRMQMRDSLFELLDNIYDVECLTLTDKAVGALDGVSDYDLPIFHNLVKLVLRVDNWSCWELLPNILASSPNLESLLLPWGVDLAQTSEQYVCGLWRQPTVVPECLSSHLQTIEFGSFSGTEDEFLLAEYLLLYGKALRKVSVYCSESERKSRIRKKLLWFGRGSKSCKIDFQPGFEAYVLDFQIRKNVNSSPDDRKKRLQKSQISLTEERRKRNIALLVEKVMAELEFVTEEDAP